MPMVLPWWAHLPQRRSSWWASALRAERSSGSSLKSSERLLQRSTRWSRYTSSVRKASHSSQHLQMLSQKNAALCNCNSSSLFCCRGTGEATRHPATWLAHKWRSNGCSHNTWLSLRCWFCLCSIIQHTLTKCQSHVWESVSGCLILYMPVALLMGQFLPTGQQDAYDKTSNNNTVEVSA